MNPLTADLDPEFDPMNPSRQWNAPVLPVQPGLPLHQRPYVQWVTAPGKLPRATLCRPETPPGFVSFVEPAAPDSWTELRYNALISLAGALTGVFGLLAITAVLTAALAANLRDGWLTITGLLLCGACLYLANVSMKWGFRLISNLNDAYNL